LIPLSKQRFLWYPSPMFNIGFPELILILIVALLVVGPSKLPELARSLGKAFGQFRRMADDVRDTIQQEVSLEEKQEEKQVNDVQKGEEGKLDEPTKP
jgi:Tat protein translocase TatB subunit